MLTGLIDFYCSNGMIDGAYMGKKLRRHTSGLDLEAFRPTLEGSVIRMYEHIDECQAMSQIQVDDARVEDLLKTGCQFSPQLAKKLYEQFREEVSARGRTAWAVYSALTYWASHGAADNQFSVRRIGNDNVSRTLADRELKVAKIVAGLDWQELAA